VTAALPDLMTPRLRLRPLCLDDIPAVQASFPRWEIVQFMPRTLPWPYPPDGAQSFIRDHALPTMHQGIAWHWSIRPVASPDQLIGIVTLQDEADNNRGFWIDPAWQGQGFASETAIAVTDFWFDTLGRSLLRVSKAAPNLASRRISLRQGMRLIATSERDYVGGRLPAELWEISRDEWHAFRRAVAPDIRLDADMA
jgi:RimJ/RimL family protein N-acetyltransferase